MRGAASSTGAGRSARTACRSSARWPALSAETLVERRETVIADLADDGDVLELSFEGRSLRIPGHARAELVACYEAEAPFRVADLPGGLDEAGRLVLVRRLVREGFLRISV